ncbi:16S rRNA (uracil(1498)-N(3))-methyltransferase [Candidatus Methylospira mobilis]|uniref:Ribosomal RNA small subunit methyltransferase E n=1 Tax=Candidatus Methylospira mobilis TaxID=1808979 RepID=A0A5Q0BRM1_9GAMM|nr:16S rRNA (uracil(1498)-N(3))-methyltransferase [Candidatus Methylospira mobilis]QFY44718.1 16S rRNA (uracil(1498)-N(3))-methyltransferase [Candidatus Methylospira mobilis]WNV05741.1 16S rRNA (uracil(1498)-N(3))-methyltransferase [Candidatus Methylospira mobilis]
MRISRFYLPVKLTAGSTLTPDQESAHYMHTVLRLQKGAQLSVFNGDGEEYTATVLDATGARFAIQLGAVPTSVDRESGLHTHLGLGISRGERMDLAIQKAVELGANIITPLFTERCVVQLNAARKQQRWQHWFKVIQSACEQCGRNRIPELRQPQELAEWIPGQQGLRLLLDPLNGKRLTELSPAAGLVILSGPEGGFSDKERTFALQAGFTGLRLGPRILRTETAALAALAAVQTLWGDLG